MSVQLLSGLPLLVGGDVALHGDCCCSPSCFPDLCAVPSPTNCRNCYDPDCDGGSCLEWQSIEVAIDGVGDVVTPPYLGPSECLDGFDCHCEVFNSSFIHYFSNGCSTLWTVREPSPPYPLFDNCGTSEVASECNLWRISRGVSVRVVTTSKQTSYTAGNKTSIVLPNFTTLVAGYANQLHVCTDYDILPGHYVIVTMVMTGGGPGYLGDIYGNTKMFLYSFGNGAKVDPSCADDQYYLGCGPDIGGEATLFLSSRYTRDPITRERVYHADCDDHEQLCQLGEATVTVEAPVVTDCPEEPPPPP